MIYFSQLVLKEHMREKDMKNGYYIHFDGRQSVGVANKIDMQMEELGHYFSIKEVDVKTVPRTFTERVVGLLPWKSISRDYAGALEELEQPDFLYVRRTVADQEYVEFWKNIKQRFPGCKIIVEIYTYPYDKDDFWKWNAWPFYFKEKIYRPQLKKYLDRFVTYTKDSEIFGINTICTTNGIVCEKVKRIKGEYEDKRIHLLGVAYMQRQHGYERVIEGLGQYYKKGNKNYQVCLKLVGDGPEKKKYQRLVHKYHLENYVDFYPTTSGQELDELYDWADIALAAFGMYKVNYHEAIGALKTRECLAKGIPILSGSPIDILPSDFPYAKIFKNDRKAINIEEVIAFFETMKREGKSKEKIADILRTYAQQHASMQAVMKPVVDYIEI